jgi:uncharacterized membrane protein (UPF0127 family)
MFHSHLKPDEGMLLVDTRDSRIGTSIHMLFVFMNLGIVWINSKNQVVDIIIARAWHLFYTPCQPARYTLEIDPVRLNEFRKGDLVEFKNV